MKIKDILYVIGAIAVMYWLFRNGFFGSAKTFRKSAKTIQRGTEREKREQQRREFRDYYPYDLEDLKDRFKLHTPIQPKPKPKEPIFHILPIRKPEPIREIKPITPIREPVFKRRIPLIRMLVN